MRNHWCDKVHQIERTGILWLADISNVPDLLRTHGRSVSFLNSEEISNVKLFKAITEEQTNT